MGFFVCTCTVNIQSVCILFEKMHIQNTPSKLLTVLHDHAAKRSFFLRKLKDFCQWLATNKHDLCSMIWLLDTTTHNNSKILNNEISQFCKNCFVVEMEKKCIFGKFLSILKFNV